MVKYRITTNPGGTCPLKIERRYLGIWIWQDFAHEIDVAETRIRDEIAKKKQKIKKEVLKEFEV